MEKIALTNRYAHPFFFENSPSLGLGALALDTPSRTTAAHCTRSRPRARITHTGSLALDWFTGVQSRPRGSSAGRNVHFGPGDCAPTFRAPQRSTQCSVDGHTLSQTANLNLSVCECKCVCGKKLSVPIRR